MSEGRSPIEVDTDEEICIRCGSWFLDTGWECNDCGFDNMPFYYSGLKEKPHAQ